MTQRSFRCPECQKPLALDLTGSAHQACSHCGLHVDVVDAIPLLLPPKGPTTVLGPERVFRWPALYNRLTRLKALVSGEFETLGVAELVRSRDVLDVGSGPTLRAEHAEYRADDALSYTGIELSLPFLLSLRTENPSDKFLFAQASIDSIPFADKEFDTTIVSFVLHHLPGDPRAAIQELVRVTRKHLVIYDHLRSDSPLVSGLQGLYWGVFDGGHNYMTRSEWRRCLGSLHTVREIRSGPFGQILRIILEVA